jgi:hypothetical protein
MNAAAACLARPRAALAPVVMPRRFSRAARRRRVALNNTSTSTLAIIKDANTSAAIQQAASTVFGGPFGPTGATGPSGDQNHIQYNMLAALNKIVANTAATAENVGSGIVSGTRYRGNFATGGWINGPGTGTSDSIPAMLSNGEFVVNAMAAERNRGLLERINSGFGIADEIARMGGGDALPRGWNDNASTPAPRVVPVVASGGQDFAAVVAELREVKAELREIKKGQENNTRVTADGSNTTVRTLAAVAEQVAGSIDQGSEKLAREKRMARYMRP